MQKYDPRWHRKFRWTTRTSITGEAVKVCKDCDTDRSMHHSDRCGD